MNEHNETVKVKKQVSSKYQELTKNEDTTLKALGNGLRKVRIHRGLNKVEFAEMMNVSRPTLYNLEDGLPTVKLIDYIRAAELLNCKLKISIEVYDNNE